MDAELVSRLQRLLRLGAGSRKRIRMSTVVQGGYLSSRDPLEAYHHLELLQLMGLGSLEVVEAVFLEEWRLDQRARARGESPPLAKRSRMKRVYFETVPLRLLGPYCRDLAG